jgi:hypothetical protein
VIALHPVIVSYSILLNIIKVKMASLLSHGCGPHPVLGEWRRQSRPEKKQWNTIVKVNKAASTGTNFHMLMSRVILKLACLFIKKSGKSL